MLGVLDILVLIVHVILCLLLIGIVLIQGGKGASLSASFGLGGSGSAFGAQSDSLMVKWTRNIAILFLGTALGLTVLAKSTGSLMQTHTPTAAEESEPAVEAVRAEPEETPAEPDARSEEAVQPPAPEAAPTQ